MGTINTSMHAVQQAQDDLSELDSLPPLGQDMVSIIHGCQFRVSALAKKLGVAFCLHSPPVRGSGNLGFVFFAFLFSLY